MSKYRKLIAAIVTFAVGQLAAHGIEVSAELEQSVVGLLVALSVYLPTNDG